MEPIRFHSARLGRDVAATHTPRPFLVMRSGSGRKAHYGSLAAARRAASGRDRLFFDFAPGTGVFIGYAEEL